MQQVGLGLKIERDEMDQNGQLHIIYSKKEHGGLAVGHV
jgi:hypothetical protein